MAISVKSMPNPIQFLLILAKRIHSLMGWTRSSYYILGGFLLVVCLTGYHWQPLLEEYLALINPAHHLWKQIDWLLLGIWSVMLLLIMTGADIKKDSPMIAVGFIGGLLIESWGTQTEIWFYYTSERPPLWIIPAWPIAGLCIDRFYGFLDKYLLAILPECKEVVFESLYWVIMPAFYVLMVFFVWPSLDKPMTILALIYSAYLILTPIDYRTVLLIFIAGTGLGYLLEYWGTTRFCWTYYTRETPPLFSIPAHGIAAIFFWRMARFVRKIQNNHPDK